ncbi:MAG: hypothetical protein WC570_02615 [Patescibacteria group bacterium]
MKEFRDKISPDKDTGQWFSTLKQEIMELKTEEEKVPRLVATVDQLSTLDTARVDKMIIPDRVTSASIDRGIRYVNQVLRPAGFEKVGLSVRGGFLTDLKRAKSILAGYNQTNEKQPILFASGDLPIRNWFNPKYYYEDLTVKEKWPPSISQLVGWRLHNVGSIVSLQNKFQQLQSLTDKIAGKKLIRWDIYGINDDADKIIPLMDHDTMLAIEYYPRFGHPDDFFIRLDQLRSKYRDKEIGISFDPVYYHMAVRLYKGILTPEQYFQKIIKERPEQLMMMEVNQMADNAIKPHTACFEGKLNFYKLFYDYGQKMHNLTYIPHFAYEPHPKYYEKMMAEGKEYFVKIMDSFKGNDKYYKQEMKRSNK